jgi:hypothetical protein
MKALLDGKVDRMRSQMMSFANDGLEVYKFILFLSSEFCLIVNILSDKY